MRLEQYLEGVTTCPDKEVLCDGRLLHRLTIDWGIYDNYTILIKGDYDTVVDHFRTCGRYKLLSRKKYYPETEAMTEKNFTVSRFNYLPGTIVLQVEDISQPPTISMSHSQHYKKQQKDYDITVTLHPYQKRRHVKDMNWQQVMVQVLKDICNYAREEGLRVCLPEATGHTQDQRHPRMIYYNPEEST